jgi:hypothetical protein
MSSRKGAGTGNKSTAYEKALRVLNDERLRQACRLVLLQGSTPTTKDEDKPKHEDTKMTSISVDGTENNEKKEKTKKTVLQQLIKSYSECEAAVKIIEKEASSDVLLTTAPSMPLSRSSTTGAIRPHAKALLHAKHSTLGLKSTTTTSSGTLVNRGNRMHRPDTKIMRGSRTSLTVPPSHFAGGGNNLAMASAAANSASAVAATTTTSSDLNPPPEARHFLAMLNKDTPKERKVSSQLSSLSSLSSTKTKKLSPSQIAPKGKTSPQRNRKIEDVEKEQEESPQELEDDTSANSDTVGKEKRKGRPLTGGLKRTRSSGSESSSPDRRVQPRRLGRTSE